jgi:toxin ParE1/3/4
MSAKQVVPREAAHQDVETALEHYLKEAGSAVAMNFIDQLEKAYVHIARHPATGSPRYAQELNLPGLRSWAVTGFPHLVFYVETENQIDVWRVLHERRDLPERLRET